jgi:hypothetical protein
MKTICLFIVALMCLHFTANAQYPAVGSKSFTFGITGLANIGIFPASRAGTLLFRKQATEKMAYRFSGSLRLGLWKNETPQPTNGLINSNTNNSLNVNLGFGIQRKINVSADDATSRLVPYYGIDLSLGTAFYNSESISNEVVDETLTPDPNDKNGDMKKSTFKSSSPFQVGLSPFIGFQYFLLKNVAIGAEFSTSVMYSPVNKGKMTQLVIYGGKDITPPQNTYETNGYQFTAMPLFGDVITVSVFF